MYCDIDKMHKILSNAMNNVSLKKSEIKEFYSFLTEEEKIDGEFLYGKRNMSFDVIERFRETKVFIIKILKSLGCDDNFINDYISDKKIRCLFVKTKEEIFTRLAILDMAGISVIEALLNPRIICNYTDYMIYTAIVNLQKYIVMNGLKDNERISVNDIFEYISDESNDFEETKSINFAIKYLTKRYNNKFKIEV